MKEKRISLRYLGKEAKSPTNLRHGVITHDSRIGVNFCAGGRRQEQPEEG